MDFSNNTYKNRYRNFVLVTVIPILVLYVAFMIIPIAQSFFYSLFKWSGFSTDMEFLGLRNYVSLLHDEYFIQSVVNSFKYIIYGGILSIGIALIFCYSLSNIKSRKLKDLIQMILFAPNTISPVALGLTWTFLLNTRWGLVNNFLEKIGLDFLKRGWLGSDYIFGAVLSLLVWIHVGYFIVIIMAAQERIPESLYESAKLDGASSWKVFTKIIVP